MEPTTRSTSVQHKPPGRVRVGYLLRMYPRFTQTFVVNEILELERQGVQVHILSLRKPTDGQFHESISRVQARVDYLPECAVESPARIASAHWALLRSGAWGYLGSAAAALRYGGVDFTDFWQAALVLGWARKRKLDHVHVHFGTHEASVAYLARQMGGPTYSMTMHAFDIFRENVDRRLLAVKINNSRFTVTVSEFNRRFLIDLCPGVDPNQVRVNYNGIDLDWFEYREEGRRPWSILGIGRLIEKKGFIHLVRAVRRLRDAGHPVTCTIVGDGTERAGLRDEIERLELTEVVQMPGGLPQDRVRELLWRSACLALPCVRAADGNIDALPTVLLEAMACGCPCVSTRLSGVPEIIESGQSGVLAPPGNVAALAAAIECVLMDREVAVQMARHGRRRVEELFDVRQAAGRMREWFAEPLQPRSAGRATEATASPGDPAVRIDAHAGVP